MLEELLYKKRERILEFIDVARNDEILNELRDLHEADIAELLETFNHDDRLYVFNLLDKAIKPHVIIELEESIKEYLIAELDNETIAEIIEEVDSDEAVDIVQDLPITQQEEILSSVNREVAEEVTGLIHYDEDTAGGIMGLEFLSVDEDTKVEDVENLIKEYTEQDGDNFYNVWVTNKDGVLRGFVPLQDIISADNNALIKEITDEEVKYVYPDTDQEEVAILSQKYDLVSVPVIDYANKIIGVITFDDIQDVIDEEADEDIARLTGAGSVEISEQSSLKLSMARLPWLLVALVGELISALVIFQFEKDLQKVVALSFFFPVIMAMAGNIGIQASAIIVRGLATGEINAFEIKRRLFREIRTTFYNGFICAAILFGIVSIWLGNMMLGLTVSSALFAVVFLAAATGTLMPFLLNKFGADPAIATGPFITTSNDVFGLLIYLLIVTSVI